MKAPIFSPLFFISISVQPRNWQSDAKRLLDEVSLLLNED
jgi:hypothetical protein